MDTKRLRKLLVLSLSTDIDGEALAALRSIRRVLARAGKDVHWLAAQLDGGTRDQPEPKRHWTSPRTDAAVNWRGMVAYCIERTELMTMWEVTFCCSLVEQAENSRRDPWLPTTKQLTTLGKIYQKLQLAEFWSPPS